VKFAFIEAEKASLPIGFMCRQLAVTKSGFYAWRRRPESKRAREDRRLAVLVRESHELSRHNYGSPRIHEDLKQAKKIRISRKRVIRLMQTLGLKGKTRRRWVKTTDSRHDLPVAPNLLDRNFASSAPNQRWVGDITYLRTPEGWLYLAAILDLHSRMVVGWAVSAVIDRHLVIKALDAALKRRAPGAGLHHSDQGSQYASEDYQGVLEVNGITCSMSRRGDCYDNAAMESWFGTLKTELGESFESHADAKRQLFDYIEVFYNQKRRHSAIGYVSPMEFERARLDPKAAAA
jgi:putative transposase